MVWFFIIVLSALLLMTTSAMILTQLTEGVLFWFGCIQIIGFSLLFWAVKKYAKNNNQNNIYNDSIRKPDYDYRED